MDAGQAAEVAGRFSSGRAVAVVQRSADYVVFDAGNVIVKCGTGDELGIEAWACDRARRLGVPAPQVISVDTAAPVRHLALTKVPGLPLLDGRVPAEVAERGAREAGALLRRLHEDLLAGFGWIDRERFRRTAEVRGKSESWVEEITAELSPALDHLVGTGALAAEQAAMLREEMAMVLPAIEAVTQGRFLHGDLGRMHVMVDPSGGQVTGFIDWGDVQVGDPAWDLAVTKCHFQSPSEGHLRVHHARQPGLFAPFIEGYEPPSETAERFEALGAFYLAYRHAWVARLGPGHDGTPNRSLAMLRARLAPTS
jgi:aminoglycoside phosphotransferase (APT) family kinase protein